MNRRTLGFLAIAIILTMGMVALAGLDELPSDLRHQAVAAAAAFETAQNQLDRNRQSVEQMIASEPQLFRDQAAVLRSRLQEAQQNLRRAESDARTLRSLAEANRRQDRDRVQHDLKTATEATAAALAESESVRAEAERWIVAKRELPQRWAGMRNNYESLAAFDVAAATAEAHKAQADWPGKAERLGPKIAHVEELKQNALQAWNSVADSRAQAEAGNWSAVDYPALIGAAQQVEIGLKQVAQGASEANALGRQLYVDRNKVLLELDEGGPRQNVRVVETRYASSALDNPKTSQQERWEPIGQTRAQAIEDNIGMVVERKPVGNFDSEADLTPQAPGYAYVAPPGQANQYGSWQNGVWHWLPQYLILSQLLRGPSYPPIMHDDWGDYDRARRRGTEWHGHRSRSRSVPSGGGWVRSGRSAARDILDGLTGGRAGGGDSGWNRERPRAQERPGFGSGGPGGFGDSKYRSRGTFSGSRYGSRSGGFRGFGSRSYSRGFGRGFRLGRR